MMSISKWTELFPANVLLFPDAKADLADLDPVSRRRAIKALCRIAQSPSSFGKPLENQDGRPLAGFRSARANNGRLMIVWRMVEGGRVEIMAVAAAAGKRDEMTVYRTAAARRGNVEPWMEKALLQSKR